MRLAACVKIPAREILGVCRVVTRAEVPDRCLYYRSYLVADAGKFLKRYLRLRMLELFKQ